MIGYTLYHCTFLIITPEGSLMKTKIELMNMGEVAAEQYLRDKNDLYRAGISGALMDVQYDVMMNISTKLYPGNTWFSQAEVEPDNMVGKTIKLPRHMLSTHKAYSTKEVEKWASDIEAIGSKMGIHDVFFRITPKLDGYAAYDDGVKLYTRGDGRNGTDITRAVDRGLLIGDRGKGPGEIVVDKIYFADKLANHFENSRNIIAGVIKEGELDPLINAAILEGAVIFQPFSSLASWACSVDELIAELEVMWQSNIDMCKFDTDGLVIEVISDKIKVTMGCTNHHHRWQLAYKKNEEFHNIRVTGLVWQTSKNGRLTPVVQLEPTKVSGVTISKATGHHAGNILEKSIDIGAIVKVCRSGLVIPYIESVVQPAELVALPTNCSSCNSITELVGDNLTCSNSETCPAQIEGRIEFFFKTLGNCDGFGSKMIEQLCASGILTVSQIYNMSKNDFSKLIGGKTGDNMYNELIASRGRPIEDWRFLAAFSIHNIGKGGCERLLKQHLLADVFNLSIDQITAIDGFATKNATSLVNSLIGIRTQFDELMALGFKLVQTQNEAISSPISAMTIVFTGSMQRGSRTDMESLAKSLGATIGSAVSSKTTLLVIGSNVGAAKIAAATKHNIEVITEDDYLKLIGGGNND